MVHLHRENNVILVHHFPCKDPLFISAEFWGRNNFELCEFPPSSKTYTVRCRLIKFKIEIIEKVDHIFTYPDNQGNTVRFISERFSIKSRKTKSKVITLTNQNTRKQHNEPIRIRSKYTDVTGVKRGKSLVFTTYITVRTVQAIFSFDIYLIICQRERSHIVSDFPHTFLVLFVFATYQKSKTHKKLQIKTSDLGPREIYIKF